MSSSQSSSRLLHPSFRSLAASHGPSDSPDPQLRSSSEDDEKDEKKEANSGKSRWRWSPQSDLALVRVVHDQQIWRVAHGSRTATWQRVAEHVAHALQVARGSVRPHWRGTRDRYHVLCATRDRLDKTAGVRSGDSESYDEIDRLLQHCIDETKQHDAAIAENKEKERAKQAEIDAVQARLRNHTKRTLAHRTPTSASRSPTPSSASSSSSSSRPSSSPPAHEVEDLTDEKSESSERGEKETKRSRPGIKLQREMLDVQKEAFRDSKEQARALTEEIRLSREEIRRGNDLFEQYLRRQSFLHSCRAVAKPTESIYLCLRDSSITCARKGDRCYARYSSTEGGAMFQGTLLPCMHV